LKEFSFGAVVFYIKRGIIVPKVIIIPNTVFSKSR